MKQILYSHRKFEGDSVPLSENEAKNLQDGHIHLAQIADLGMGYLENHLVH